MPRMPFLRRTPRPEPALAAFAAYWNRSYACNPRAIYEKARELVPDFHGVWVVGKAHAARFPSHVEHVVAGTPEHAQLMTTATTFVNNVNWPNKLVKREGTVHVMTHHGTPLKKMGMDLRDAPGRTKETDFDALLARCARWDYSVAANPFSTRAWATAYPGLGFESLETGYPRNDVLARATADDVSRAREALGLATGEVAVLYAPTHREYETDGSELLDLGELAGELGPEHVVLARQHYLEQAGLAGGGARVRDVSAHPSVEELCLAADVLVTDYSSIMFDYAVLDRPILIHARDWETYRHMRGTYFDLLAEPPGTVATTTAGVAEALRSGEVAGAEAARHRAEFRQRFCSLEDGHAAERVVRAVWETAA